MTESSPAPEKKPVPGASPEALEAASAPGVAATSVSTPEEQASSAVFDTSGMTAEELRWEHDIFRDVLGNVNNTLRFQISLGVPLLAGCITVLNIVPPQAHQEFLNDIDRWVFIPALVSMVIAYRGLEFHWYTNKQHKKLDNNVQELYKLVRYKHHMVRLAIMLQGLGLILLMVFVLLEYK